MPLIGSTPPGGCPRHSTSLSHGCYLFLTTPITWAGAKQTCDDLHGHLVKIETEEENEELYEEAVRLNTAEVSYWIGLTDAAREGNWVWSQGERVNFTNWSTHQPDNAKVRNPDGENCAVLNTNIKGRGYWNAPRKWNDGSCASQVGAICEFIV